MSEIPEPGVPPELENLRTRTIAELPEALEAPEAIPFKISFEAYKERECEITGMNRKNAAAALKVLRDIGVNLFDEKGVGGCSNLVDEVKHVVNAGDYRNLYKSLADDIEVWELKCVRADRREDRAYDFRIYYYVLGPEGTFYVLAIKESHYNTDH